MAAAAAQEQTEQQEQELGACRSALMDQQQLHLLLQDWGTARLTLHGKLQQDDVPSAEQQEQLVQLQQAWLADISRHCGTGEHLLLLASGLAHFCGWLLHTPQCKKQRWQELLLVLHCHELQWSFHK